MKTFLFVLLGCIATYALAQTAAYTPARFQIVGDGRGAWVLDTSSGWIARCTPGEAVSCTQWAKPRWLIHDEPVVVGAVLVPMSPSRRARSVEQRFPPRQFNVSCSQLW